MYSLDRTLIDKFRKAIQTEIEILREAVSKGNFDDLVEYKKTCSKIDGLDLSLSVFNDLVKKLGEDSLGDV